MARLLGIYAALFLLLAAAVQVSLAAGQTTLSDTPPTPSPTPIGTAPPTAPPTASPAPTASPTPAPTPTPAPVVINSGAEWTNSASASIALPYPASTVGLIRLSNDNVHWSSPSPWASIVQWNITDATAGGTPADGEKHVYVQWDDGSGSWWSVGSSSIKLDRTPPTVGPVDALGCLGGVAPSGWTWEPCHPETWSEDAGLEFSLDGGPWTHEIPIWGFDFRTLRWGGGWRLEDRQICYRASDHAGNLSQPSCDTFDLNVPTHVETSNGTVYNVRFELPRPAVTGQLFTIRPIYPPDMPAMPKTAVCNWILRWGDDGFLRELPNEDFGSIWMSHLWGKGGCGEWTFTLPYTPGLTYQFDFNIDDDWRASGYIGDVYLGTYNYGLTTFKATVGTLGRGIPYSTLGLAYLLPNQFEVRPGVPVTYTLHASDTPGWSLPKPAWFWAYNNECGHNIGDDEPTNANTFTYIPDCQGPWVTGWTWENWNTHEYLRAEFDPPADKTAPLATAPQVLPTTAGQLGTTIPTLVQWTATDPRVNGVSSGVARSQLQVSRKGGAWKNVVLPSPKATSVIVNLLPSGSYRFRVRAFDDVGNKSAWSVGPVLKPRLLQQSAATLGSGWSSVSSSAFSGGTAVRSGVAGVSATLTFTGRAVSWIGTAGAGQGLVQIRVDGVLVQTIDLASLGTGDKRVLFSRLLPAGGTHTLKITGLGTYGRPNVTVDAFTVF